MNRSVYTEIINASKEKTWDVLFNQYGDIHIHNPGMIDSKFLNGATVGEKNCTRMCQFNEKLSLEEIITKVDENNSFSIEVTKHNMPLMKTMAATYELTALGDNRTEVKMISETSTSIGFLIHLMKGQLGKGLIMHLFGLKYYLETGKTVNKDNYSEVYKNY